MDNNTEDDSILYELIEYFVKKQDPELIRCKNDNTILPTTGTIKNALRYLNNRYSLPESISQEISLTLPWKFAIGDTGRLLAIVQENVIEIRRSKDEFSSVVGKASVPKDAFPQWRKLAWSPDGSILVLASSNGSLSFYNSLGSNIFSIGSKTEPQNPEILEAGDAISALMFNSLKKNPENWTYEFSTVTYSGLLKFYYLSSQGYEAKHQFSFGNFYRKGVNAFAYDHKHNLYIVAGNSITQQFLSPAPNTGLTSWRPLNDYPYYKLSFTFAEDGGSHTLSLWNYIPTFKKPEEPVIFRISISPSCNHLVCLHTDGSISLWDLPNLQLRKKWKLSEQPDYDAQNPLISAKPRRSRGSGESEFHPLDIGWWSDHAIIIARYSGAISVCSMTNLQNLLGTSPEFLYGQPQISEFFLGKGFLCLDCETIITSKKRKIENPANPDAPPDTSDSEDDDLELLTFMNYLTNFLRSFVYSITDIESFQPKRRKSKIVARTYRILGLKSTTPEELYSRKIDIEEYDEALALAKAHNLDTDLVYQTQWRKSPYSLRAIQEHLSKVTKRSWVLNECLTRVPETLEAARELLKFGLKGANLKTFLAISDEDNGKFMAEEIEDDLVFDEITANLQYTKKANEALKGMDLTRLSQAQRDLLTYRRSLLDHLDKLKTYEIIIDDPEKYRRSLYEEFRQRTVLENAVTFANDCNYRAVGIIFTYHGPKLMPHWLGIINCFPETLNPVEYEKLLPACDENGQLFLLYQQELRPMDWSEKPEFDAILGGKSDDGSRVIYEHDPSLSIYRNIELTMDLLRKWYKSRAYQIERNSLIVENALELIKIGKQHNITGLEDFLIDLETLDDLVYKVYLENMSLAQFEKLSDLEKAKLLMSTASEKNFVQHLRNYIIVFMKRKQQYLKQPLDKLLLRNYLVFVSQEDLTLPLRFFESLKHDVELLNAVEDVMSLALDCIYSCTNPQMYSRAKEIFDTIPKPQSSHALPNPVESLERELECWKILSRHGVQTTAQFIHTSKNVQEDVEMLLHQMSKSLCETQPPADEEAWSELLNDTLELQEFIFTCINPEICFEIHVKSRLTSGVKGTIQNCTSLIETKKNEHSLLKVSYNKAIELILDASIEYFNSSKSLNDTNMELARTCLHLIEDDNVLIQQEYELIHALQIFEEFDINILPLQVRLSQNRLKFIESCLEQRRDGYKRQQRLLTLAASLGIEGNNARTREGKVLQLVANKAFEAEDYEACAATCQKLIANNYFSAWKIIQSLGFCDSYSDLIVRQKCLTFALTYGPSETLEQSLSQMHLLEIQVLNKKLETWMTNYELENCDESDDEFTDAMTTPQIEVKEFVPKIIETSTDLVKNSAQIVKQSTLGILKHASKQNFWKLALNIASKTDQEETDDDLEEEEQREMRHEEQSFPFFYGSLHPDSCVSRIDTTYDRYSMPDVENTKLKICQTLVRVSLLSETSCYGLEVSDIDHFFVQAAGHVLPDDWLLGFAYLLNLKNNDTSQINEVFHNLPTTELYIQTAMYFYSVQLYRKMYPQSLDYFSYNPVSLIRKMLATTLKDDPMKRALVSWYQKLSTRESAPVKNAQHSEEEKSMDLSAENVRENGEDVSDRQGHNGIESVQEVENLYGKETFKMKSDEDEAAGWDDDNWSDFSDHSAEGIKVSLDSTATTEVLTVPVNLASADYSNTDSKGPIDDSTEQARFEIFEERFSSMKTRDDYLEIKKILKLWPGFVDSQFTAINRHPVLRMVEVVPVYFPGKIPELVVLPEYKDLLKDETIPAVVFDDFIRMCDEKLNFQARIFLRFCSSDPAHWQEAVGMMKSQDDDDFPLPILEELFFKDLTSLFPPHHPIYDKVLCEMFLNHDLTEVKPHIRILIDKLIAQKHIPYAVALWNQLAEVPPALSTFETGLRMFMNN